MTTRNTNSKLLLAVVANLVELGIAVQRYWLCTYLTLLHNVDFLVANRTKHNFDSSFYSDRLFLPKTFKLLKTAVAAIFFVRIIRSLTGVYNKFVFISMVSRKRMYVRIWNCMSRFDLWQLRLKTHGPVDGRAFADSFRIVKASGAFRHSRMHVAAEIAPQGLPTHDI